MSSALGRARDALQRQAWADAYEALAAADDGSLEPADLEGAALAAYLTGRDDESEALWARAHRAWLGDRNLARAARAAFWLGLPLLLRGEAARGGGWLARGARLLDELETDCAERGLLLVPEAVRRLRGGDAKGAAELCGRITEIGERFGDPDVLAFGRLGSGQAAIALEQMQEGLSLLDEAMVAVTVDDVSPITVGLVYCAVLLACQDAFDLARAEEWTAVLSRWCDSQQGLVPFRGECLVHRAEILHVRGQWDEALTEARRACDWLEGRPAAGRAHYEVGELQRLRGEFGAAERSFRAAGAAGRAPLPGHALLRLAEGDVKAAAAMIEREVGAESDAVARVRALPAFVEIALAREAVPAGRDAAGELSQLAEERDAALLHAIAAQALGTVLLAEGEPRAAAAALQESRALWQELGAPYEEARARVALALACRELGDGDGAELELEAARETFGRLGAAPDLERLAGRPVAADAGLTARELEVLALVAEGRTNREIATRLVLSPHTVRRHLQNVFRKLGVSSRTAATAHAFQHGLVADVARKDH